jgi:UDP-N-acetylglucosamine--N-acetylmuramyl-(pentapeptide) pyrophosphoryl-undecaprenol N-acetylglucosamine transferase
MSGNKKGYIVTIAAGGTGGHLFPGIAIAQALRRLGVRSHFVLGEPRGEEKWLARYNFMFSRIASAPLLREFTLSAFESVVKNIIALTKSFTIIRRLAPSLAIGMGGYTSGPFLMSCYFCQIPFVIYEQNIIPGLTNRLLSRLALHSFIAFENAKLKSKSVHTVGNPLRDEVRPIPKKDALKRLNLKGNKPTIVIIGGSQGAMSINSSVVDAFKKGWGKDYEFLIQTGRDRFNLVSKVFNEMKIEGLCRDFFEDMGAVYSSADLYVGRAGGGIFEVLCAGIPLILIPYPFASDNHQMINARYLEKKGAGIIIEDKELSADILVDTIDGLMGDKNRLREMRAMSLALAKPDSADISAGIILEELKKR